MEPIPSCAQSRCIALTLAVSSLMPLVASTAHAASSLMALETFGTNGWLAPGSNSYLGTANGERGLAWNPVTKNLVLTSRNGAVNSVAILDGQTGVVNKTLNTTGVVTVSTLPMAHAAVSEDGAIFVSSVQSGSSTSYKVYKWNSEADTNASTIAFSKINPTTTSSSFRYGDAFDVYGSGSDVIFASAGTISTAGTIDGQQINSNFMIGKLDGSNTSTVYHAIPSTKTTSNDYGRSVSFVDADTIIGNQGTSAKFTDFNVTTDAITSTGANITGTLALGGSERGLDYTVLNGTALLATINTNTSLISVYDVTDNDNFQLLATGTTTTGTLVSNLVGFSSVKWGEALSPNSQILYGMSTNQGIQAMVFTTSTVPEPSATVLVALSALGLLARRRR